jgi:hypothetical protein
MFNWIKIKNTLPPIGKFVLLHDVYGSFRVGELVSDNDWDCFYDGDNTWVDVSVIDSWCEIEGPE